ADPEAVDRELLDQARRALPAHLCGEQATDALACRGREVAGRELEAPTSHPRLVAPHVGPGLARPDVTRLVQVGEPAVVPEKRAERGGARPSAPHDEHGTIELQPSRVTKQQGASPRGSTRPGGGGSSPGRSGVCAAPSSTARGRPPAPARSGGRRSS